LFEICFDFLFESFFSVCFDYLNNFNHFFFKVQLQHDGWHGFVKSYC
jgi:hypothetical protein